MSYFFCNYRYDRRLFFTPHWSSASRPHAVFKKHRQLVMNLNFTSIKAEHQPITPCRLSCNVRRPNCFLVCKQKMEKRFTVLTHRGKGLNEKIQHGAYLSYFWQMTRKCCSTLAILDLFFYSFTKITVRHRAEAYTLILHVKLSIETNCLLSSFTARKSFLFWYL